MGGAPRRPHSIRGLDERACLCGYGLPWFVAGVLGAAYNFDTPALDARLRFMTRATGADQNRQNQELTIFHDVAKALTSSLDLDSILQTIMEKMAEYFRPDTWSLLMVDDERE